ncbi:MAG: SDR family oxidoreductase [Burkholderiaceae bacterium]|jgi:NAD(P)-dependent dehydrogenase (short-subunit alcohol dehydrogenase family)|nr:SDR family oxidoreductase [Burkholderiaceae bacterium]
MADRFDFNGKAALVTGAASGIGEAVARALAAGGAKVVVADFNGEGARQVAASLPHATAVQLDVSDAPSVQKLVEQTLATYGALHLAVNNAGIGGVNLPTAEYPLDAWHRMIDVNLHSVFYGMKYQIPAIIQSGGGAIVNMASILGSVGWRGSVGYVAAKHAVVGMTQAAALEYAQQGVRINAVGPGFIDTPLLKDQDQQAHAALRALHPIGRLGTAEEVAALTCFLLSGSASNITGSYHLVDGGFTAQ